MAMPDSARRIIHLPVLPAAVLIAGAVALAGGCQQAAVNTTQESLAAVEERLQSLQAEIEASHAALDELQAADGNRTAYLDSRLAALDSRLDTLPERIDVSCPEPAAPPAVTECEPVRRVVVSNDKLLVGELEAIWIDPPGINVVARMDTGATSSSLHAENLVTFERDGEDWVRFDMRAESGDPVSVEQPIIRHVRVIQQADPRGSRRPVVAMRVHLGDIQDTYEFTLADRSHLENPMILGRNFLTDVALVDVGRQFIQPRRDPSADR